jgi:hypothetical protein
MLPRDFIIRVYQLCRKDVLPPSSLKKKAGFPSELPVPLYSKTYVSTTIMLIMFPE